MEWLFLYDNKLSGTVPRELGNLSNLELLFLYRNELSGSIPRELGSLSNLQRLNLRDNTDLTGPIPRTFTSLVNLNTLRLDGTRICAPQDTSFQTWLGGVRARSGVVNCVEESNDRAALIALYQATSGPSWENNDGWLNDGPLGDWYGVTTNEEGRVTSLVLVGNSLQGNIPSSLSDLKKLQLLLLYNNELSGSIPRELGSLGNLQLLYLHSNQLTGSIPSELGRLSNLQAFLLHDKPVVRDYPIGIGQPWVTFKSCGLRSISYWGRSHLNWVVWEIWNGCI